MFLFCQADWGVRRIIRWWEALEGQTVSTCFCCILGYFNGDKVTWILLMFQFNNQRHYVCIHTPNSDWRSSQSEVKFLKQKKNHEVGHQPMFMLPSCSSDVTTQTTTCWVDTLVSNHEALNSADSSPLGRVACILFSASVFLFVYFSVNSFLIPHAVSLLTPVLCCGQQQHELCGIQVALLLNVTDWPDGKNFNLKLPHIFCVHGVFMWCGTWAADAVSHGWASLLFPFYLMQRHSVSFRWSK